MDTMEIWERIDDGERTSALEAWTVLRDMLADARRRHVAPEEAIDAAAVTALSALDRLDQRETDRDTLLFELRSERGRCRELDDLLIRMLDPDAEDRLSDYAACEAALDEIERAVRDAEPRPSAVVTTPPPAIGEPDREARTRRFAMLGCALLAVIPVVLLGLKIASEQRQATSPFADEVVTGATLELLSPGEEEGRLRMKASWADDAIASSSAQGRLESIVSWPDVYRDPVLDDAEAWSPGRADEGIEWVEVGWNVAVETSAVVIVEGAHPGAIIAVDELAQIGENTLGAGRRVRLWSGTMPPSSEPRFVLIHLPEARWMRGVRVVLDTARVPGHNSIDAVGLLGE